MARTYILAAFGLQMSCCLSLVLSLFRFFILFCFRFRLCAFTEAAALPSFVQSFFDHTCMCPDSHTQLSNNCSRPFLFLSLSFSVSLEMSLFKSILVPLLPFSLRIESTPYVFSPPDGGFLPYDNRLDF